MSDRRIAIIGTAPTYRNTPWDDPTLEIWCLNDSWVLNLPRADRWFDIHGIGKMYFRDPAKKITQADVPPGFFVRPAGHLEWLAQQKIPVYLQEAVPSIPSSRTFPKAEIEAKFGPHFASTPAWMIGLALLEGVKEIHVYGVHLATEWEYVRQKPNMTFLLGLAAGLGVKIVLPQGCPLLKESHQYAYEPDPDIPKLHAQRRLTGLIQERERVAQQAATQSWWRKDRNVTSRLAWLDAQIMDAKLSVAHSIAGRAPAGI